MIYNMLLSVAVKIWNVPVIGEIGRRMIVLATDPLKKDPPKNDVMSQDELAEFLSNKGAAAEGGSLAGLNDMVTDYGGGIYNIGQNALIYIAAITVALIGAGFMMHGKNVQKRQELKDGIGWQLVGAVMAFGGVGLLAFIMSAANGFF